MAEVVQEVAECLPLVRFQYEYSLGRPHGEPRIATVESPVL